MNAIHPRIRTVAIALLLVGMSSRLFSQAEKPTDAPESPEVLLPTMVLEAEGKEDVFFVPLPLFAEPRMEFPSFFESIEAPLTFPPDFLSVSISPSEPLQRTKERSSLYTEGSLGVGTMASLEGALALFQRGEDSKFNLKFSHRSRDGYQFHKAGNGYFDRVDQMTGGGGWKLSKQTELGIEGTVEEREVGLQGVSSSYSNLYRFIEGTGTLTHDFTGGLQFSTEIGIGYANRLLTGTLPQAQSETLGNTLLRLNYGGDNGFIALEGTLSGGTYSELSKQGFWVGGGTLKGEWNPVSRLSIAGGVGILWADKLEVPFHIDLQVKPQEELLFSLKGSYTVETVSYGELWKEIGPIAQSDSPIHPKTYAVGFRGEAKGLENRASVAIQGEWQKRHNALQLSPYDRVYEHFPVQEASLSTYRVQVEGAYGFSPGILGNLKWIWLLGDRALLEKEHTLEGAFRFSPEHKPLGGTLSGTWMTGMGTSLPILTIGGYYRPRESVEISLSLEDILSLTGEERRTSIEPFITPGFRVLLKTTVMF